MFKRLNLVKSGRDGAVYCEKVINVFVQICEGYDVFSVDR